MTRDELIKISTRELEKLPVDELAIIARHFQTEDRAELARQLADEAEEMWSGDHEAPVPEAEWPSAHLQLLLGMHRDEKREALLAEVWGPGCDANDRTVDTHVKTLRAKLRERDPALDPIVTHRGLGYALVLPVASGG